MVPKNYPKNVNLRMAPGASRRAQSSRTILQRRFPAACRQSNAGRDHLLALEQRSRSAA